MITGFLASIRNQPVSIAPDASDQDDAARTPHALVSAVELLAALPLAFARAGHDSLRVAWQSPLLGSFGDGKPIVILAPPLVGGDLIVQPLSMWLKALGYRPVTTRRIHAPRSILPAICISPGDFRCHAARSAESNPDHAFHRHDTGAVCGCCPPGLDIRCHRLRCAASARRRFARSLRFIWLAAVARHGRAAPAAEKHWHRTGLK